jgi:hypothetical protein
MQSGTSAAKTPRWRSRHRNSTIIQEVDGEQIATPQDLRDKIRAARIARKENVTIPFGRPPKSHMTSDGMPQLHFDQLNVVAHHLHAVRTGEDQWQQRENFKLTGDDDAHAWPPMSAEAIDEAVIKGLAIPKLSRRKLVDTNKWPKWRDQEWGQLTKHDKQSMFGEPRVTATRLSYLGFGRTYTRSIQTAWKKLKRHAELATAESDTDEQ